MPKKIDLTDKTFGYLSVIKEFGRNKHGQRLWLCKCLNCYNFKIVTTSNLKYNNTTSCGCKRDELQKRAINKRHKLDPNGLNNHLFVYKLNGNKRERGIIKPCSQCGKLIFVSLPKLKKTKHSFCNLECYYKFSKTGEYKKCPICGTDFWVTPKNKKEGSDKYCSRKCRSKAQEKKIINTCKYCGKEIRTIPARIKENRDNYCSHECYWNSMKKQITKTCPICNTIFTVKESEINRGGGIYCSKECASKANSGENCHLWQGGTSFEPYCPKFNNAKKEEIRNKFGRKCLICGKTEEENGKKLSVHHVNYDKMQGCDGKQWDLVPLCLSCHSRLHASSDQEYWTNLIRSILSWRVIQT